LGLKQKQKKEYEQSKNLHQESQSVGLETVFHDFDLNVTCIRKPNRLGLKL